MTVTTVEDEAGFQTELQKAGGKLVVIEFTAQWCGPCKQFSPVFESFSKKFNSVVFLKVDVDDNQDLAMQYEVSAMPTFLFLKKQKELDRILGADAETVESRIKELGTRKRSKSPSHHHQGHIKQQQQQALQNQVPPPEVSASNFQNDDGSSRVDAGNNKLQMMNVSGLDLNAHAATLHNLQQLQLLNMQQEQQQQGQFSGPQIMANHPHIGPNQLINYGADQNFPMAQLSSQFPKLPSSQLVISPSAGIAQNIPSNPLGPSESQGQKDIYNSNEEEEASGSKNEIRETPSRDPKRAILHKKKSTHRTKSASRKESTRGPPATHGKSVRSANKADIESKSSSGEHKGGTGLKKKPAVSTVQIRLADGTKLNGNFTASQPISKIREFILNAQPEHAARPFTLNAIMPHREITNEAMSLQEAKLTNSVIVQRFISSS